MKVESPSEESIVIERGAEPFTDFAKITLEDNPKNKKHRGGVGTHFPTLLHLVLTRAEKDGYSHICSWQPHGRCFMVHNRELFVQEVMPQYFRQSQYASFQRQLNLYGFQRFSQKSLDHGSYYHEMFLRTRADLCQGILRAKEKDLRAFKAAREEPDFHKMSPMPPITEADIQATESVLMQQKSSGNKDGRQANAFTDDSFTLNKPSEDPLANLFKTVMDGIDTNDSWMEPRPIAPGLEAGNQYSQPPFALPKPEPLPMPSFLSNGGFQTQECLSMQAPSMSLTSLPETKPFSPLDAPAKVHEKRPMGPDFERRLSKRQANELSSSDWAEASHSLQDDGIADMVGFLEDVDFD